MLPWFGARLRNTQLVRRGHKDVTQLSAAPFVRHSLTSHTHLQSAAVPSVLIIVASFVSDQPPTIMIGALALATASAPFYVPLPGFSRAQPATALRVQPIHASEETLWHAIRSARKSKQECLVDADGDVIERRKNKIHIPASEGAFEAFMNQEMFDAVETNIEAVVNPVEEEA